MFRKIILHKKYFYDFYEIQTEKVKDKIDYVLDLIRKVQRVPETFLKHLVGTEGLYEIRVKSGSGIYRIFCFFDEGKLVVLINAFHKKTQKTPKRDLELALKLKEEYFKEKENGN